MPFPVTGKKLEMIILSEVRQERQLSQDIISGDIKNVYKWISLQKRNSLTDLEKNLMVTKKKGDREQLAGSD